MTSLRILIIHEVSYEKKVVYEFQDFAERLVKMGHSVTVMDFDECGDGSGQVKKISRTGIAEVVLENTPFVNFPILKYITGRLNHARRIRKKFSNKEVDVVFLYSVFISGVNTVRLANQFNVPVVYRVLDIYHLLRKNSLSSFILYLGERFIYRNATCICLTNASLEGYIHKMAKKKIAPIRILQHGVDTGHFKKHPRNKKIMNILGIKENDKVLFFLGTLYSFSGLDVLLNHFDRIERKIPGVKFLIVGGGEAESILRSIIVKKGLIENVILAGFKGYEELPDYLSLATIGLTPFVTNDITKGIVPIKNLQYLSAGIPVVSEPLEDVARLFPEYSSGSVYAKIEEPESFIEKILELLLNQDLRERLSVNAVKHIAENFDIEIQMKKLTQILKESIEIRKKS